MGGWKIIDLNCKLYLYVVKTDDSYLSLNGGAKARVVQAGIHCSVLKTCIVHKLTIKAPAPMY